MIAFMSKIPRYGDNDDDIVYTRGTYTTKKKGGSMKKYVISSTEFESKDEAMAQIAEWAEGGTLDSKARVYEVKRKYQPVLSKSVDVELMEVEK